MTPLFRLVAMGSQDITDAVMDRLLQLTLTDAAGRQSDELRLVLDDRKLADGSTAQLPQIGTQLAVFLGWAGQGELTYMGVYEVDELQLSEPGQTLEIVARASEMHGPIRAPRTRSWHRITLGELVQRIAHEHGLQAHVAPELQQRMLQHVDQHAESDLALLTRLARAHDARAKLADGAILVGSPQALIALRPRFAPLLSIERAQLLRWTYRHEARRPGGQARSRQHAAGGVKASYWDVQQAKRLEVAVGQPPYSHLRPLYASRQQALDAAQAAYCSGQRHEQTLQLELLGDARLVADVQLQLQLHPQLPQRWVIERAEHVLDASGWRTQLHCLLPAAAASRIDDLDEPTEP